MRIGHQAISLGLGDVLLEGVKTDAIRAEKNAIRQWKFRVARLNGEPNAYLQLLPEGIYEQTINTIAKNINTGDPISVSMNGGIGDHLEALSMLLPWSRNQGCHLSLQMNTVRKQQIKPLLKHRDEINWDEGNNNVKRSISVMVLRAAAIGYGQSSRYQSWIPQEETKQQNELNWLCCWRAEGVGDKLSAHSRSVPWTLVHRFYTQLLKDNPKRRIVDITKWKEWESIRLKEMGVKVVKPQEESLLGLVKRTRMSRVVTIDTALVHLCAAAGQRADLLLSYFPDERWHELNKSIHSYGQLIKIWRSAQFGSWSGVLESLRSSLVEEE